jgi:hypothetical protein
MQTMSSNAWTVLIFHFYAAAFPMLSQVVCGLFERSLCVVFYVNGTDDELEYDELLHTDCNQKLLRTSKCQQLQRTIGLPSR